MTANQDPQVGAVFGNWTVLGPGELVDLGTYRARMSPVRCVCGVTKTVQTGSLRRGASRGCGHDRDAYAPGLKHGFTHARDTNHERLYRIWTGIKYRCTNPKASRYGLYGGRGISRCPGWDDYAVFREWAMTHGYADDLQIDRIDPDGNYEPINCRWVTPRFNSQRARKPGAVTKAAA